MTTTPTVYLISGATRGIGLAIVTQLATRENTIVFAGARDPSAAKGLQALESKYRGKVHIVKLTSPNEVDNKAAVAKVKETAGRLDVVIANAGISNSYVPSVEVGLNAMRENFEINVLGPLVLFQASYPLLKSSSDSPKFIVISTAVGSIQIGTTFPIPNLPYGTTKAAVNWLTVKLHYEYPGLSASIGSSQGSNADTHPLVSVPLHPGAVKTDMTQFAVELLPDLDNYPMITTEESATGVLKIVDAAKREEEGPKLMNYDGTTLPW
ncbi:NAD(P)-binding protein [Calocera cornea HHB12733]|uniref:NAD(P)-binding protein n=1 Tax=Calocera cornea HHB12733 TaxID=1353952 RepID=A0A165E962_9BASI|nr:NAD(P)-binding protein [Calocera cornea HHB12733]